MSANLRVLFLMYHINIKLSEFKLNIVRKAMNFNKEIMRFKSFLHLRLTSLILLKQAKSITHAIRYNHFQFGTIY